MVAGRQPKIVVIGGVAAGPKAAARARRLAPEAEIIIIEQGDTLSYAGCGLPFYVGGLVPDSRALLTTQAGTLRDASYFAAEKDIVVLTGHRAKAIDRSNKQVIVDDLARGTELRISYDKLVLATGSTPASPPVDGLDISGVFHLSHPEDAIALREAAKNADVESAGVVGGGLVGLETADAFLNRDKQVTVIEMADQLLPGLLDWEMAALVARHLTRQGIDVKTSHPLTRLEADGEGRLAAMVAGQSRIPVQIAVVATGVKPNVQLARDAGLPVGELGGIVVDEQLRTADPDIYAGGDCVENTHLVSGRQVYAPMGSTANKHGRVIGENVLGGKATFRGVLGTTALQVADLNVARTGLTEKEARDNGIPVVTATVSGFDCAHYYPTHMSMVLKMVVDARNSRLLGAQIVGLGDAVKRIDVVSMAILAEANVDSLASADLGYSPPFSSAIDIIAHAANVITNKLRGLAHGVNCLELKARLDEEQDLVLLDVRTEAEVRSNRFKKDRAINVPLGELRERAKELPLDKEIVTICEMGTRSYEAQLILKAQGYERVAFVEGGLLAWPFGR